MRLPAALRTAAGCLVLAAGCHPLRPPPDLSLDPVRLADQVRAAQARVQRVQGETRLHLDAPRSATLRQFAAAEHPDRVHLEELDFFGNPAVVLVTADGRFALYDSREKVLYRGAATPQNLSRLVPVPLTAPELAAVLLGTFPLPEGAPAGVRADGPRLRLRYERGGVIDQYWIGAHAAVERVVRSVGGRDAFRVDFTGHRQRGDVWFPQEVELRSAPANVRLAVIWTELDLNGEPQPELFAPPAPKGARVVELDPVGLAPAP